LDDLYRIDTKVFEDYFHVEQSIVLDTIRMPYYRFFIKTGEIKTRKVGKWCI